MPRKKSGCASGGFGKDEKCDLTGIALKHTLMNASQYKGIANPKVVIGKILIENPSLKAKMKDVVSAVESAVKEVNSWGIERQIAETKKLGLVIGTKPEKQKEGTLPALPGAADRKVVMRMAPYPSGPLHIGNTRMVILNDEYRKMYGGELILCFDDTIGSKEKFVIKEAYDLIKDSLEWLGVKYDKVVYKSDRMDIFYRYAEDMIRRGLAYVCLCPSENLRMNRADRKECSHRGYGTDKNLELWKGMLSGRFKEGEASVRLKTDMAHPNPAFRDRVLLRISSSIHPRVGDKYRVWPMLEFSWAVDDYELGMTHVLRGKDLIMEDDMEVFVWDKLGVPKDIVPRFLHYGMLKLEEAKLSKSKSRASIESGEFTGWDDPRTWSLQSLRRRGIMPQAIRNFIVKMGMSLADVTVPAEILYSENRRIVDSTAKRYFAVFDPVKLAVKDVPNNKEGGMVRIQSHPEFPGLGTRDVPVDPRSIFVERQDLDKNRGKVVGLMNLFSVKLDEEPRFVSESVGMELQKMHWVSESNVSVSVVMPDGEVKTALAEPDLSRASPGDIIQLVRTGFCRVDGVGKSGKDMVLYFAHK